MESVGAVWFFGGTSSTDSRSPFSVGEGERAGAAIPHSEFRILLSLFVEGWHTLMVGGGLRPHITE